MKKLPARYRAGQSSLPSAQAEDDGNLVRPTKTVAPVAATTTAPKATPAPAAALKDGMVLKRGGGGSAAAPRQMQVQVQDEEAAAAEAERRRAAARAKAARASEQQEEEKEQTLMQDKKKHEKIKQEEEEEEDVDALGKILGERVLPPKQHAKADNDSDSDSSGSSSGSGSGSSSSSSEEEAPSMPMIRPVFVSKSARSTVKDEAQLEAEEEEARKKEEEEARQRVLASKALLAERMTEIKNAAAAAAVMQKELVSVNVNDGDETEEYELWKVRELTRMKREREERRVWEEQKAEILRRRAMDDEEILAEDGDRSKGEKTQQKFLQRYYHKGAFYQDELEKEYGGVDFSAPTGVDAEIQDKSLLPKVMQVRSKWALRGRTKYTHLTDQDTTFAGGLTNKARFGALPEEMVENLEKKRAGVGSVALPKEKKHKRDE